MYKVELQFANRSETQTFANRRDARIYACDLADMFNAKEFWPDYENSRFIVDASHLTVERMQ